MLISYVVDLEWYHQIINLVLTFKMVQCNNFSTIAGDIEKKELDADGSVTPVMYAQLLAIYLYQNDLCNAKFLWKRIPNQCKTENPELAYVWNVGKAMWQRDFPATYAALNSTQWTDNVADIMKALHEEVVERATQLVCRAYTSVSLTTAAALTGKTSEDISRQRDWQVEGDMVTPPKPTPPAPALIVSEEQLSKLTDFVSFLEN